VQLSDAVQIYGTGTGSFAGLISDVKLSTPDGNWAMESIEETNLCIKDSPSTGGSRGWTANDKFSVIVAVMQGHTPHLALVPVVACGFPPCALQLRQDHVQFGRISTGSVGNHHHDSHEEVVRSGK
jgi:hypothetical protein